MISNPPSITSKFVFDAELFRVTESVLDYKNGTTIVHNDVIVTPSVIVFPMTDTHEIYLISEYRYLLKKKVLGAVAGSIEFDQKPLFVAKKELLEEAGITAAQWEELAKVELSRSIVRHQMYIFLARDLEMGSPHPETDEEITIIKMPLDEAVAKVFSGEIYHGPSMLGILMLDRLRSVKRKAESTR